MKFIHSTACVLFVCFAFAVQGQTVTATIPVGSAPSAVAVNPVTNKIYVANGGSNSVTVINGADNTTSTVGVGGSPSAVAVDTVTNKIYVVNSTSSSVTVIDGASNTGLTVPVGSSPNGIAVNSATNKIYVSSMHGVTVIDGASNNATPINVGTYNTSVAVNQVTNKIYVAGLQTLFVIDGNNNNPTSVAVGSISAVSLAVNPVTNKIYIGGDSSTEIVVDGITNAITHLTVAGYPIAINTFTNKIYSPFAVTDGVTNTSTVIPASPNSLPFAVTVDATANKTYIANFLSNSVSVVDGVTNSETSLLVGTGPTAITANPVTGKVYAVNSKDSTVTVIDGASNQVVATIPPADVPDPDAIAVNPVTNRIYVVNYLSDFVSVIDGATDSFIALIPMGTNPQAIAVNPITNKIYVANTGSANLAVIDGSTNNVIANIPTGAYPRGVAVNPVTNKVYVSCYNNNPGNFSIIDGVTNVATSIYVRGNPTDIAVNPVTNKIYVADYGSSSLTVVDGVTNALTNIQTGNPDWLAVNPMTNQIYALTPNGGDISVVDGLTNTPISFAIGTGVEQLALNPLTNKIYVTDYFAGFVDVIDGATNTVTRVRVPANPFYVAVNPASNKIYVTAGGSVTVLDGLTNTTSNLGLVTNPGVMAVNPVTGKIYVTNPLQSYYNSGGGVSVIEERPLARTPLLTAITPLPNNETGITDPTFTFTSTSQTVTSPNGVYFQTDTTQNAWTKASGTNPTFTGTLPPVKPGFHILYAFSGDGQDSTSNQSASTITGAVQAYGFVVTSPYVGLDMTTQGTWNGVYGGDGYIIPSAASRIPSYVNVNMTGDTLYTWAQLTTDVRGAQNAAGSTKRIASAFTTYYPNSFEINLNFNDGQTHRVALYMLDWDSSARAQTITILDANTQAVIDTESFSNFHDGEYAIYNLSGNVIVKVTPTAGNSAVISGIFFGPAGPPSVFVPSSSAAFLGSDTSTEGLWTGKYGKDGYQIVNDVTQLPSYATLTPTGEITYTWAGQTSDPRALQTSPGSAQGVASAYTTSTVPATAFSLNLNLIDGYTHKVSLYLLDWDKQNRTESVTILDAASNTVLDTRKISNFQNGVWESWKITGNVIVQFTPSLVPAVVSGIFFN